ncbi:PQ-loop domain-containing transporter [Francisella adeliensis]|uniref:PQ-loop repeat-containing protein n=1 Tax=Francisella adeliensis TaxID=2007306 RepID=A0A2Z4XYB2_9GAMM|nr:PQ-loop repeat-containing protein [Francisella adeliensis]AXA33871.1 hypothetical protein CDH04_05310 [Francisella adeliensis]MBK2085773.1 PQ-loop repeat-containing protein [Francisella adeliensis]MBK2097651.1 PQ-loop repeat-containing protein [Francisella adeliensis]QIW12108.1 PQ-loop repeat-containing protein [Francisella adeliensis]QIW13982.1 PQ-loop repeat-containing protein [Francisella adeliensis]
MQNIGYITLNISLVIYFIHFIPQTIHNQFKHTTINISLWTHSFMILANCFDLIYAIGFDFQWQYICVAVVLLSFLFIQQLQILSDRRNRLMILHTFCIFIFLLVCIFLITFIKSINKEFLLIFGVASSVAYNTYWLPQIYKNFKQKRADGFSIYFLNLSLILKLCDISSGIFLNWPLVSVISSFCLLIVVGIQFIQYFYYKK